MKVIILIKSVKGKAPYYSSEEFQDDIYDNVVGTMDDCIEYLFSKINNVPDPDEIVLFSDCLEIITKFENEVYYFYEKDLNDIYDRNLVPIGEKVLDLIYKRVIEDDYCNVKVEGRRFKNV